MGDMTLKTIAEAMRDIDFCMFSTRTEGGAIAARPMSDNREVEYDGSSRFFSYDDSRTVSDIAANPDAVDSAFARRGHYQRDRTRHSAKYAAAHVS